MRQPGILWAVAFYEAKALLRTRIAAIFAVGLFVSVSYGLLYINSLWETHALPASISLTATTMAGLILVFIGFFLASGTLSEGRLVFADAVKWELKNE